VGTAHALAETGEIPLTGDTTRIVLEEWVGPVPVTIRAEGGHPTFAQLTVARLPEQAAVPPSRDVLARVLGLEVDDLLGGDWSPEALSCGLPFIFVPLHDRAAVARARIHMDAFEAAFEAARVKEIMVFAPGGERPGTDFRARMFAPGLNVPEDPATGSACAALGGYLAARDSRRDGTLRWVVEQGFEMGRPSMLDVEADLARGVGDSRARRRRHRAGRRGDDGDQVSAGRRACAWRSALATPTAQPAWSIQPAVGLPAGQVGGGERRLAARAWMLIAVRGDGVQPSAGVEVERDSCKDEHERGEVGEPVAA